MAFAFCKKMARPKLFYQYTRRQIYVLGVESSYDDTSSAIVHDSGNILGEGHFSQSKFHVEAGGVIPIVAYNLHAQYLKSTVNTSMERSQLHFKDLDAIAVTVKPGLVLSLKAGLEYVKDLCTLYTKPMIPIHHMEAHALTARMFEDVRFPFLVLLISGGHCILAIANSVDKFYTLGNTINNSPGQALDIIARKAKLNNLKKFRGLVGGAAIEAAAVEGDSSKFKFSQCPLLSQKNCSFSFAGLISQAAYHVKQQEIKHNLEPDEVIPEIKDFCAGFLLAIARHLSQRLEIAFKYIKIRELLKDNEKCLVMSGGVACNKFIQKAIKKVCDHYDYRMVVPPAKLCTDNGAMIAWNGIERLRENFSVVQPNNLSSVIEIPRCPLGEDITNDVKVVTKGMKFKFMKLGSYLDISISEDR